MTSFEKKVAIGIGIAVLLIGGWWTYLFRQVEQRGLKHILNEVWEGKQR